MKNKLVIIVSGPTAVGKTTLAIRLAQQFQTEIISADSRQCYRELSIGVARPSLEELSLVPHHFIASHSIEEKINAVVFENYAWRKLEDLFRLHDTVIMVGGTGLYLKAFCEGLDEMPAISSDVRNNIQQQYSANGLEWLQAAIQEKDPVWFKQGEIHNPQRIMRALEVVTATGKSILEFQQGKKVKRNVAFIKIGLELPRQELIQRIHQRVDEMIALGLVDEVAQLLPYRSINALQTVGYKEIIEFLDGNCTLQTAIEKIKTNTRQYAKRQMTWFKKDTQINWFAPEDYLSIMQYLH